MKSQSQHSFAQVPSISIPRSSFDRSSGYKTTIDFDLIYPIFCDEMLPGDTANLNLHAFARLATPIYPLMDNMYIDTFWFAVPYRLLWDNWEKFNGEQDNPDDSVDFLIPTMTTPAGTGNANGTISDYLGIPPNVPDLEHSCLYHRAYNLCWNQWFRDENLQDSAPFQKGDGPDVEASYPLRFRGKRHDYFTSCLPFAQKDFGQPVLLPLGETAPIIGTIPVDSLSITGAGAPLFNTDGDGLTANLSASISSTNTDWSAQSGQSGIGAATWADPALAGTGTTDLTAGFADLTNATAATINQLRVAFQIQRMMERDARGGTRYIEIIKSHFGVTSPDARLQRVEYLGGGSTRIGITPVAQTTVGFDTVSVDTPLGTLAGFGTANVSGSGFTKSFTEHTIVIGLICARADVNYQQGLHRKFSRSTRFDHYFPTLAHLGEQAVLQKEIFASGVPAEDDLVFGYNERFAELRYRPNMVTSKMRSADPQTLDAWHLAQDFQNAPILDGAFIVQNTPIDRVIAVPSEPHLILDAFISLKHARPLPTYGTPGMIDHF